MKKLLFLLVFLLSACESPELNINDKITKEMQKNVVSFDVHEVFNLKQYGENVEITVDNTIEYDDGIFYTTNSMKEIQNHQVVSDYDFNTYVDIFKDVGYIKDENSSWYEVELSQIYKLKMGSIDPLSIVNSILYDAKKQTNKNGDQIFGTKEDYDRVVSVIEQDVFEDMFKSSVFNFIEIPKAYEYTVTATLKYDELFKVEYIEFNLSDFIRKYEDYHQDQLKIEITSLDVDLRLDFDNYDQTDIASPSDGIDWIIKPDVTTELRIDDIKNDFDIGEVNANVIYNSDLGKYDANISLSLKEDVKYLSFEIYYLSEGEKIHSYPSQVFDVKAFETYLIYYQSFEEKIDHIYFKMRYIPANSSEIINVSEKVKFDLEEPSHELELDLSKFDDSFADLVPNILVEYSGYGKDQKKIYNVNIDLYSKENIRNGEIIIYLYDEDNTKARWPIQKSDIVIDQYERITFTEEIDFMPENIYIEIRYNTSYLRYYEQFITADFKQVEGIMYSNKYTLNEEVSVKVTEWPDSTWMQNKYHFQIDFIEPIDEFNAYIYFVDENYELLGWEYIYDFDILETYQYVSDLYVNVNTIYIDLESKGNILEKYKILGELSTTNE
ncbi:hypothetical protein RJG79_02395 [Mycoplasmatota bacterium WC44]